MTTPLRCTLLVDGQPYADTAADYDASTPTALSGLSVSWGRGTVLDQPDTATATFAIAQRGGRATFPAGLATGVPVAVTAAATLYPDPTQSTFVDPGFDTGEGGRAPSNATTSVVPASPTTVTRRNLHRNPSVEVNGWSVGGWGTGGAGNATRVTAGDGISGATYWRMAWTTAAAAGSYPNTTTSTSTSNHAAVTPGQTYTVSAWVRSSLARNVRLLSVGHAADGTGFNQTAGSVVALTADAWKRLSMTWTAPAGNPLLRVVVELPNVAMPIGATVDIDAVLVEPGTTLDTYFDGSTPDTEAVDYAWTGTAGTSSSTASTWPVGSHLRVVAVDASEPGGVLLAPDAFSASPAAWDDIPSTSVGQRWSASVRVSAPAGARVDVAPVAWRSPDGTRVDVGEPFTVTATGAWQVVDVPDIWPTIDGAWVGVQVMTSDLPTWGDLDTSWTATPRSWLDYATTLVDDVQVLAPAAGTVRTVLVFAGRVTDLETSWDDGLPHGGGLLTQITAADFTADLQNTPVGDEPWLVEPLVDRVDRVLDLAGGQVRAVVDDSVADTLVTWRDVDAQPAAGLVVELAASVDAIAWSAVHQTEGAYYWLEDPSNRPALLVLAEGADGVVRIVPVDELDQATRVSARVVPRDEVRLTQSVADISTIVDVSWQEQGLDDDGKVTTTERHVVRVDEALIERHGHRRVSLSTQLQSAADAGAVAGRLAARTAVEGWRLDGLTWDTDLVRVWDPDTTNAVLDLLDGTIRVGRALLIEDTPPWFFTDTLAVYLEGGEITFDAGRWLLPMTVSRAGEVGHSATWAELDMSWTWQDFDPPIAWGDLYGVGVTAATQLPAPARLPEVTRA